MNAATADFGTEETAMQEYFREGEGRAQALDNRGPLRITAEGKLSPEIVDAYLRTGFYIFEGVLGTEEVSELKADLHDMLDRLPAHRGAPVDRRGRPALGADLRVSPLMWAKPLGDPLGGSAIASARYPVKMIEAISTANLPDEIVYIITGPLQFSDAALRVYGHPALLAVAATLNGEDFVPFSEGMIIKKPGEGSAFAWHQDGLTHWNNPDWDSQIHGFNFMAQLYPSTAANGVWFIPGSHTQGKRDIKAMVAAAGGNRLPAAVPLICNAGDVAISNRQVLHSSFANATNDWRVTLNLGFHRRSSVLGVRTRGIDGDTNTYDAERIRKRSAMIGYAIEARRQSFADEKSYAYRPHVESGERFSWDAAARAQIKGYNLLDLII
jgi:hypothetical protein